MGLSLGEHIVEVVVLLMGLAGLFIGLTKWIANETIKKVNGHDRDIQQIKDDLNKVKLEMASLEIRMLKEFNDIKTNYKSRFDDVKEVMHSNHIEVIKNQDSLFAKVDNQMTMCRLIQQSKEEKEK